MTVAFWIMLRLPGRTCVRLMGGRRREERKDGWERQLWVLEVSYDVPFDVKVAFLV